VTTYFGNNTTSAGSDSGYSARCVRNDTAFVSYLCPGSGTQNVQELSAYVGVSGNVKLAIYSNDYSTLIGQGAAETAVSTGPAWQGHMTAAAMATNPTQLTGGVEYVLVMTLDSNNTTIYNTAAGDSVCQYSGTGSDYTGSTFPTPLGGSWGTSGYAEWCIRCGVDAAGGAALTRFLSILGTGT
jgi:hypothetical protein